jgi:hypothetical protein
MSTEATFAPTDERGSEILDAMEAESISPFRWHIETDARSYWINAQGAPADGFEALLDRLASDWREHLNRAPDS